MPPVDSGFEECGAVPLGVLLGITGLTGVEYDTGAVDRGFELEEGAVPPVDTGLELEGGAVPPVESDL